VTIGSVESLPLSRVPGLDLPFAICRGKQASLVLLPAQTDLWPGPLQHFVAAAMRASIAADAWEWIDPVVGCVSDQ
jgi:hypothetical protein